MVLVPASATRGAPLCEGAPESSVQPNASRKRAWRSKNGVSRALVVRSIVSTRTRNMPSAPRSSIIKSVRTSSTRRPAMNTSEQSVLAVYAVAIDASGLPTSRNAAAMAKIRAPVATTTQRRFTDYARRVKVTEPRLSA
jgi:hypothetical protein